MASLITPQRGGAMQSGKRLREWARRMRIETTALYLAVRDPRTPWPAKLVTAAVVGYAASPLDLIPDVIPVLGLLDDLVIVPLGIALAVRLIPKPILADCRRRAREAGKRASGAGWIAALVVLVWIGLASLLAWAVWCAVA
jgi:uncharacterized membrane protein YkvA (DUF1232 family)